MGLKLSNLKGRTDHVTVEYAGEEVRVTYYPDALTPAREEAFQAALQEEGTTAGTIILELVSELLAGWDVYVDDDQQEQLGTDVESLRTVPSAFLTRVFLAIQGELQSPGGQKGGTSAGG